MSTAERLDQLDYKSTLQELVAGAGKSAPIYDLTEEGPDHDKRFFAKVIVDGTVLGTGHGRSKRTAEQAAAAVAAQALTALKQMLEPPRPRALSTPCRSCPRSRRSVVDWNGWWSVVASTTSMSAGSAPFGGRPAGRSSTA